MKTIPSIPLIISLLFVSVSAKDLVLEKTISVTMANRGGACVFMDCMSDDVMRSNSSEASKRTTPCSSFKIWNTLIGIECQIISSPADSFYKWDGETRVITAWNKDLTLKDAFGVSSVPAFQNLARKIGPVQMQKWIDTIGYGDRDISSGIDIFWLPREGKKSILISPEEQAHLIRKLVTGKLPFSENARNILKEIMFVKNTTKGTLYGKTGSGSNIGGDPKQSIGWFVGYVESSKKTYAFACLVKGENVVGKNARDIVELILVKNEML